MNSREHKFSITKFTSDSIAPNELYQLERERECDTYRDREKDTNRDRERERETVRERDRERNRERNSNPAVIPADKLTYHILEKVQKVR